jgi:hypothetical protein
MALSDACEYSRLYLCDGNKGDHRTYEVPGRPSVNVQSVTLDSIMSAAMATPSVIKMDIQGAEMRAILGMSAVLDGAPEIALFTEYWPAGFAQAGTDPAVFLAALHERGFELLVIDEAHRLLQRVVTTEDLVPALGPYGEANLLCTKGRWATLDRYRDHAVVAPR